MRWTQIDVTGPEDAEETAIASLVSVGCSGVQVIRQEDLPEFDDDTVTRAVSDCPARSRLGAEDVLVRGYLPDGQDPTADLQAALDRSGVWTTLSRACHVQVTTIDDPGWSRSWRQYFKASRVGKKIVVAPSWSRYRARKDDLVVLLDPGMAFGTGQHGSTRLCVQALEEHVRPGDRVIDVGCGSGILSITAVRLGAAAVMALDTDPVAVATTRVNVEMNQVAERVTIEQGSLPSSWSGVDIVVANILAPVIVHIAADAASALSPNGIFISSGIVPSQAIDVRLALDSCGLELVEQSCSAGWTSLIARKPVLRPCESRDNASH